MRKTSKALFQNVTFLAILVLFNCIPSIASAQDSKETFILQCEFASLLFDRLELARENVVLTKEQKIKGLEELQFSPSEGYQIGERFLYENLVTVLVRIYGLENSLPNAYSLEDAWKLLLERNILKDTDKMDNYVLYERAVEIIKDIEPIPGYKPGLILLPRVPVGPDVSPTE